MRWNRLPLEDVKTPSQYWQELRNSEMNDFPLISGIALDLFSISAMSVEYKRVFSETKRSSATTGTSCQLQRLKPSSANFFGWTTISLPRISHLRSSTSYSRSLIGGQFDITFKIREPGSHLSSNSKYPAVSHLRHAGT